MLINKLLRKHYRKFFSLHEVCKNPPMKEGRSQKRSGGKRKSSPQNLCGPGGLCVRLPLLAVKPSQARSCQIVQGDASIPEFRTPHLEKLPNEPILESSICLQTKGNIHKVYQTNRKNEPILAGPLLPSFPAQSCPVVPDCATYPPTGHFPETRNTKYATCLLKTTYENKPPQSVLFRVDAGKERALSFFHDRAVA
jgi:hypothetical protein